MTLTLVSLSVAMITTGGCMLNYQRGGGGRRFEVPLIFAGLVLMTGGLAVARDVVAGSSKILWALHKAPPVVSTASSR